MTSKTISSAVASFVQSQLLFPKLLYFMLNVLLYSTYTFTAKYFEEVWRISNHHFGYIIGLCAISFTGSLLWTMIADRTGRHKLIILLTSLGYTGSFFLLRTNVFIDAPSHVRISFVAICFGLSNFFTSALFPLLDNRVFMMLSADPQFSKELFGRQRLFGVLGQSFITLVNGATIGIFGFDAMFFNLLLSSFIFALLIVMGIPSVLVIGKESTQKSQSPSEQPVVNDAKADVLPFSQSVGHLLCSLDYIVFLVIVVIAGTTRGVAGNYLPQYLEKSMNLSTLGVSFMLQSRVITEIGIFFMGKQLMKWFGVRWLLFLAQITGFMRVFAYAILPTYYPWTLVPLIVELLKGINNACLVSAGVRYVHDFAPRGAEATAQGLFSGAHSYLANAASGFFGGFILQVYHDNSNSFKILFAYTSVLSAIGIVLFSIRHTFFPHCKRL